MTGSMRTFVTERTDGRRGQTEAILKDQKSWSKKQLFVAMLSSSDVRFEIVVWIYNYLPLLHLVVIVQRCYTSVFLFQGLDAFEIFPLCPFSFPSYHFGSFPVDSSEHVAACFANPPSPAFILVWALSIVHFRCLLDWAVLCLFVLLL